MQASSISSVRSCLVHGEVSVLMSHNSDRRNVANISKVRCAVCAYSAFLETRNLLPVHCRSEEIANVDTNVHVPVHLAAG